jgi:hypothetical protein
MDMANKKKSSVGKISRAKATTSKAGVTSSRSRRYGCGGKLRTK